MSTCERGRNATAPSRSTVKPPLTWLKMTPWTFSLFLKACLELAPAFLAARLVARQHRLAERVLDALQIDFDGVADLDFVSAARALEFTERDAPLGLGSDVDDGDVLLDADDGPFDDGPFLQAPPCANDSSSIAAKSSRDGADAVVAVAMKSPIAVRRRLMLRAFRTHGPCGPARPTALPEIRQAGAKPSGRNDGFRVRRAAAGLEAGLGPPTARGVTRTSARSGATSMMWRPGPRGYSGWRRCGQAWRRPAPPN